MSEKKDEKKTKSKTVKKEKAESAVKETVKKAVKKTAAKKTVKKAENSEAEMPLRYNYDKPEKPRRIKGFEVFSLVFSSFSKPKNHTEISRIVGGVSLTTNE